MSDELTSLVRWNPWQEIADLRTEMDEMMSRLFGRFPAPMAGWWEAPTATRFTPVDVLSRGDDLVVRAELPGIDPERDVEITVADGMLTIHGERRQEHRDEGDRYWRVESRYGAFRRSIPLPEGVSEDDIRATYKDGILEVVVPGAAVARRARRVPIRTGPTLRRLKAPRKKAG